MAISVIEEALKLTNERFREEIEDELPPENYESLDQWVNEAIDKYGSHYSWEEMTELYDYLADHYHEEEFPYD